MGLEPYGAASSAAPLWGWGAPVWGAGPPQRWWRRGAPGGERYPQVAALWCLCLTLVTHSACFCIKCVVIALGE